MAFREIDFVGTQ